MFTSEFNERSRSNPLCDFRLGTVATSDHETPLTVSRLDCCGRCEREEDTENTKLGRHVDAYTKCEGTGGISTVDESQELQ